MKKKECNMAIDMHAQRERERVKTLQRPQGHVP